MFNCLDEFFRRTSAWTFDQEITLQEDVIEYGFGNPVDTTVVRLLGVSHNNLPVTAASSSNIIVASLGVLAPGETFPDGDAEFPYVASDINESNIFTYAIYRPEFISIITAPDEEARKYPLKVSIALSLGRTCLECDCGEWSVPDWMWDMYFQDWYDGVLGRLYGMPAKPWASPSHAQYHMRRFRNAMAYRKQESPRGFTWGTPKAWRFPRGW